MLPNTVSHYLSDFAPPDGHLLGYWLDAQRTFTVLMLHQRDSEPRFSADYFPEIVGHWGHQLDRRDFNVSQFAQSLSTGLVGADDGTRQRLERLLERLIAGQPIDDVLAECRAACGLPPRGPPLPTEPRRGPSMTSEAHFRVASELVAALSNADPAARDAAAARLRYFGFNEDDGPLFIREALRKYRQQEQR